MLEIRSFRLEDAEGASRVIARYLREVNSYDYTPEQIGRLLGEFTPERVGERFGPKLSFVAVQEEVVGTATLRGDELGSVFVRPDLHGQGIGKRLVAHVEDAARQRGVEVLRAFSSLTALPFYLHLGYERVGEKREGDGEVTVEICKSL